MIGGFLGVVNSTGTCIDDGQWTEERERAREVRNSRLTIYNEIASNMETHVIHGCIGSWIAGAIEAGIERVMYVLRGRELWMIPALMFLFAAGYVYIITVT